MRRELDVRVKKKKKKQIQGMVPTVGDDGDAVVHSIVSGFRGPPRRGVVTHTWLR